MFKVRLGHQPPARPVPRYALGPMQAEAAQRHVSWAVFLRIVGGIVGSVALLAGSLVLYRSDVLRVQHVQVVGAQIVDANAAALAARVGHQSLLRLDSGEAAKRVSA